VVLFNFYVGGRAVNIKACYRPCRVVPEMNENSNDLHTTSNVRERLKISTSVGLSGDCWKWFVKWHLLRVLVVLSAACFK